VYLDYARTFLEPEQIDAVDVASLPGYGSAQGPRESRGGGG